MWPGSRASVAHLSGREGHCRLGAHTEGLEGGCRRGLLWLERGPEDHFRLGPRQAERLGALGREGRLHGGKKDTRRQRLGEQKRAEDTRAGAHC